jgi:hypothetical protein
MKSIEIWKRRPDNSGLGSRGQLAKFKADFVSKFVKDNNIQTLIDFGCGDLYNSSMIEVPSYLGVDIVAHNMPDNPRANTFEAVVSRFDEFECEEPADMVLCMDVLYHILPGEQDYLKAALENMLKSTKKYLVIYAQDSYDENIVWKGHMFNSPWRQLLEEMDVELTYHQKQEEYGDGPRSEAVFFVYEKKQ